MWYSHWYGFLSPENSVSDGEGWRNIRLKKNGFGISSRLERGIKDINSVLSGLQIDATAFGFIGTYFYQIRPIVL